MQLPRECAASYLKVELRKRSPRFWIWSLYHDGSNNLIQQSNGTYSGAEDAFRAGKAAQAQFEALR